MRVNLLIYLTLRPYNLTTFQQFLTTLHDYFKEGFGNIHTRSIIHFIPVLFFNSAIFFGY
ncbi:MAG: hypothetical protein JWR09_768 [Mucilaginibacter sp.]|nr:hypothetical protein [Mucilaginibacter sp.]